MKSEGACVKSEVCVSCDDVNIHQLVAVSLHWLCVPP